MPQDPKPWNGSYGEPEDLESLGELEDLYDYWKNLKIEELPYQDRGLIQSIVSYIHSAVESERKQMEKEIEEIKDRFYWIGYDKAMEVMSEDREED